MDEYRTVLGACSSQEWRTPSALLHLGWLRYPSEVLPLAWTDFNWDAGLFLVRSPKTERNAGRGMRKCSMFPNEGLRAEIEAWRNLSAKDGSKAGGCVINVCRDAVDFRKALIRRCGSIVGSAGITPWKKFFNSFRSTRVTEVKRDYGAHAESQWIGHSPDVAEKHYEQFTPEVLPRAGISQ